ncbi:MAG: hypothetical protein IPP36_11270 [Nitrosomonadales bacterium]|nr:hypothetical protein [Nitrosomonadales bacterium]
MKDTKCQNGQCPDFRQIPTENRKTNNLIDKFSSCMNETARHLAPTEVQQVIDLIVDEQRSITSISH